MVAIDGSKIKACNSQDKYSTQKKVASRITCFEKQATTYIELLDENDKADNKNPPPLRGELLTQSFYRRKNCTFIIQKCGIPKKVAQNCGMLYSFGHTSSEDA